MSGRRNSFLVAATFSVAQMGAVKLLVVAVFVKYVRVRTYVRTCVRTRTCLTNTVSSGGNIINLAHSRMR